MPATPKKIKFEDIQPGDVIRVVDVVDLKVIQNRGHEIQAEDGHFVLPESPHTGVVRTIQLVSREIPPLPEDLGSVVKIGRDNFMKVANIPGPEDDWVRSGTGARWTSERLRALAEESDGFEVIA